MKILLRHSFFVLCALYLGGAHWVLLQMTAWTGMLITRTQNQSVVEAVRTTFDGRHPCPLCKAINSAKNQEKDQQNKASIVKKSQDLKLVKLKIRTLISPQISSGENEWPEVALVGLERMEAPPTHPPIV